jgi:glycosyltransferase involved in cell wall biosynthesis
MPVCMIQFSVIIPNYNHAAFLKERIESVLAQTYQDFELIILDDCSADNSKNVIEQYRQHPKVSHIVYNNSNSGFPSKQWQKGVQLAKGEWIWIAESDDVAEPLFLETLVECVQQYPTAGIIYSNSNKENTNDVTDRFKTTAGETNFDFSTTNWNQSHLIKGETAIKNYLSKKNIILNISSTVIKKKYLDGLAPEIKNMKYFADWHVYIRMAAIADIGYSNNLLNTFRRHPGSLIHSSGLIGIKSDYFRILNLLSKQPYIINKSDLVNYFTYNYLKPGLKGEGLIFFIRLMARYFFINPSLAMVVIKKLFNRSKTQTRPHNFF